MNNKLPSKLHLHKLSKELEIHFDGQEYRLECELLRVHSPSAEVQGHGNPKLQTGKKHVTVNGIEMVGNYAVKLTFDDGHDSGLYSWDFLYDLCINKDKYWNEYLSQIHEAGASRDPEASVVKLI